jgi:hypothetical protein
VISRELFQECFEIVVREGIFFEIGFGAEAPSNLCNLNVAAEAAPHKTRTCGE